MEKLFDSLSCELSKNDLDNHFLITMKYENENRLNLETIDNLEKALEFVEKSTEKYSLIVNSSTKYWCNGIDLNWVHKNRELGK